MPDRSSTPADRQTRWVFAFGVAIVQNAVAVYAVVSSNRSILSDGACIGGIFGTLANIVILGIVVLWVAVLSVRSLWLKRWHVHIEPLLLVMLSSALAIAIGQYAALRCTV